jgi:hypothetical protein
MIVKSHDGASVNSEERNLLEEALRLMHYVAGGAPSDPKSHIVAMSILSHLSEIESVRPPNVTKKTLAARKRLAEDADLLTDVIKHSPKYSNIEFKCLDDYDKCRRHRGRYNLLCILSYIVCIGRRIIPLVPHT